MRPSFFSLALAAFLLVACVAEASDPPLAPTRLPAVKSTQTAELPTPVPFTPHAPVLRVAVLGDTVTKNVWALFDAAGADYWSAATQADYWPSLYRLAPPSLDLQPATAQGEPPPVLCDHATCIAKVTLRPDLTWTDGSPFTAYDVSFTANTALQFGLGLNWQRAYNPSILEYAVPLDNTTVEFHFKKMPTVADWQYGVLQGPIVNRAYWQPRILELSGLLPEESLLASIKELEAELAWMQTELQNMELSLSAITPESTAYVKTSRQANHLEDNLTGVKNTLGKKRADYEAKLAEARKSLYAIDNAIEPTLGPWKFANQVASRFENKANLGTPFGDPWFERVRYITYSDESEAAEALLDDEVDLILTLDGLSLDTVNLLKGNPEISLWRNKTHSARFLAINPANRYLADPALRQAMACMIDSYALMETLGGYVAPLSGFVVDDPWRHEGAVTPCSGLTGDARLTEAIRLLKVAGYSWEREPASRVSGIGLKGPDGNFLPAYSLLTVEQEPMRELTALYIAHQVEMLGLSVDVTASNLDELLYVVYSSGGYDMALLGWRLSAYPSYLCDWFMPLDQDPAISNGSRPALAGSPRLEAVCQAWSQTSEIDLARSYAFEVQSALMEDLSLIPLYTGIRVDAYRNVRYPFAKVVDGLGGLYGAPELAVPVP